MHIIWKTTLSQSREERRDSIAKAVRENRKNAKDEGRKRVDVFVLEDAKEGLRTIKKTCPDVRNEAQAVEKAVSIALERLSNQGEH